MQDEFLKVFGIRSQLRLDDFLQRKVAMNQEKKCEWRTSPGVNMSAYTAWFEPFPRRSAAKGLLRRYRPQAACLRYCLGICFLLSCVKLRWTCSSSDMRQSSNHDRSFSNYDHLGILPPLLVWSLGSSTCCDYGRFGKCNRWAFCRGCRLE